MDDFCLIHGYDAMKSDSGPIPYCGECDPHDTPSFRTLVTLMDAADGALDRETYDQFRASDFDAPADAEFTITVGTIRKINAVFSAISRLRHEAERAPPSTLLSRIGAP